MYKKFQFQNNVPISAKYVHWCIFCGFEVSVKIAASNIQLLAAVSPLVSPVAGLPILQSGSLAENWSNITGGVKLAPLFSQAPIVSFCPWDVTTLVPSPHPGFVVTNGLTMLLCAPQCAAKKLYITKLGTKAPCDRLCLDPNISAFTINWQGLKRSFSVIICIVKYHHPMSALVSLSNGDHLLPL